MRVLRARSGLDIALALLAVGLGLWIFLGEHGESESKERLTKLDPQEVKHLLIAPEQGEPIELVRNGQGWKLIRATELPADDAKISGLLSLLEAPVLSRYPSKSLKLSQVGLDPPRLKLDADGTRIALGDINELSFRRYAMIDDEIRMIPENYLEYISAGPNDYISRKLVPYGAKLRKLSLPGLAIERDKKGQWQVAGASSEQGKDQQAAHEDIVQAWQQVSAAATSESVDDESLSEVVLGLEEGPDLRFLVIAMEPELVLARPDIKLAYHLDRDQAARLLPAPTPPAVTPDASAIPQAPAASAEQHPTSGPQNKPAAGAEAPPASETPSAPLQDLKSQAVPSKPKGVAEPAMPESQGSDSKAPAKAGKPVVQAPGEQVQPSDKSPAVIAPASGTKKPVAKPIKSAPINPPAGN